VRLHIREAKEEAMQQNVPQTQTAAWLLCTVLATAGALGTHRCYSATHLDALGGTISEARANLMSSPTIDTNRVARVVPRTGLAPAASGRRSERGHEARVREDALILLAALLQGARPTLSR
jgi:hypothetical protein